MGPRDGMSATRELFHLCYWMARTYRAQGLPDRHLWGTISLLPFEGIL
jgi:type I restriction enzyme R subunit